MNKQHRIKIDYLVESNLVDNWTQNFCTSLRNQLVGDGRELTERQVEILEQKYDEFGPEATAQENDWISQWGEKEAEEFSICARYYKVTGYFRHLSNKVDDEGNILDGFIPRKREYQKMCKNKYALKVLAAWYAEPKYPVGSLVAIRATAPSTYNNGYRPLKHRAGTPVAYFIIEQNSTAPVAACAGAKMYKIVAAGGTTVFDIEERHLKKMKRR